MDSHAHILIACVKTVLISPVGSAKKLLWEHEPASRWSQNALKAQACSQSRSSYLGDVSAGIQVKMFESLEVDDGYILTLWRWCSVHWSSSVLSKIPHLTIAHVFFSMVLDMDVPVYLYEFVYSAEIYRRSRPSFVKADHADDVGFMFGGCFWNGHAKIIGRYDMLHGIMYLLCK